MLRVAVVTEDPGWHGAELKRAFRARRIGTRFLSLRHCRFDLVRGCRGIVMPGFAERLPDGVFVRGVPGGTLEQVVLRLDFLHALRELGIPVYNDGRAIEKTVDKGMTSFLLKRSGVPTPPTWVCEDMAEARALLMRETAAGHDVVAKPLFGSQGVGVRRLKAGDSVPDESECHGAWYLQRYLESSPDGASGWHDWRVLVIGGVPVSAMARHGRTWINNVAQGARCEAAELGDDLGRTAADAARAVGADYAGVDLMRGRDGVLQVIEVNGIPAWRGLQRVTGFNIAERLVDDFVTRHLTRPLEAVC